MQQLVERFEGIGGLGRGLRISERVVASDRQPPILPARTASGLERANPPEGRPRRKRRPEREHLVQSLGVECSLHLAGCQEGLDFGCEVEIAITLGVIQRQDAEAVPCEEHAAHVAVVDRERELPVQTLQHALAPLLVGMHEHLGVAPGAEQMPPGFQLAP